MEEKGYRSRSVSQRLKTIPPFQTKPPRLFLFRTSLFFFSALQSVANRQGKMTESVIRNKPGMASVKDMPILQDGPPPGGFAPVRYARRIPNNGPSAMAIFLAAFGAFSYGMYRVGQGNMIRRSFLFFSLENFSAFLEFVIGFCFWVSFIICI